GAIPPELGNLAALQTLDLGWNQLSGFIPAELGALAVLEELRLGDNQLHRTRPQGARCSKSDGEALTTRESTHRSASVSQLRLRPHPAPPVERNRATSASRSVEAIDSSGN
ncbi:unnamed protein product, partial [Ectocarpus fasciculatus]